MNPNRLSTKNADWIAFDRKYCVRVGLELTLRALDRATPPILWSVFATTFFRFWFSGPLGGTFDGAVRTFAFLTFASVFGHALREASCNWREFPYWLDLSTQKARNWAVSAPILITAVALSAEIFLLRRRNELSFGVFFAISTFFGLFFVDNFASRWARKFGETSARNLRALFVDESRVNSLEDRVALSDATFPPDVEQEEKRNAEFDDAESGAFVSSQRRTREADGSERIVGEAAVEFEDGAEIAVLCLSFCPPFEGVPTFEFEQISGADVDWKTTSVQPFGVRLEAKRRLTLAKQEFEDESDSIRVEYFATFPKIGE